jgi:NTP pyrophosphatase (non-canonical NTP hydrolase)
MEMGDALTRILHLCGVLNLDIEGALLSKIDSNKTRVWNWEEMNEKHQ